MNLKELELNKDKTPLEIYSELLFLLISESKSKKIAKKKVIEVSGDYRFRGNWKKMYPNK